MKQWIVIILILLGLGWYLAVPVNLVRSDLGRHIKNGDLIVHGHWDVLYKNYYSYTHPEYPFINHHWLFGVWCYALWHYFGFSGLSAIYLTLELITFFIFFRYAQRHASLWTVSTFSLLSFPFMTLRFDIRPELISYLFCGIFLWILDAFQNNRLKSIPLILNVSILQILWVNTHMFFITGPILIALAWLQASIQKERTQAHTLRMLFFIAIGACCINPSGIHGLLAPFHLGKAYAYPIVENQSLFFLLKQNTPLSLTLFSIFIITLSLTVIPLCCLIQREGFKKYIFTMAFLFLLSLAAIMGLRMLGLYAYCWIALSAPVYSQWVATLSLQTKRIICVFLLILGMIASVAIGVLYPLKHALGITSNSNDAAVFFKQEKISGVVFNNYEIGGYLDFYLSPEQRLFIDDRMEAYPEDFIKKTYIDMQWHENTWLQLDNTYHFNVIFMMQERNDWATRFLARRLHDHINWALVFWNEDAAIFLKRNTQNAPIIKRNEIFYTATIHLSDPASH